MAVWMRNRKEDISTVLNMLFCLILNSQKSPRIKECKDSNTLSLSNNSWLSLELRRNEIVFKYLIQFYLATVTYKTQMLPTL